MFNPVQDSGPFLSLYERFLQCSYSFNFPDASSALLS